MKRLLLSVLLAIAFCGPSWAAEVTLTVTSLPPGQKLGPGVMALVTITGLPKDADTRWHQRPSAEGDLLLEFWDKQKQQPVLFFHSAKAGRKSLGLQLASVGLDELAWLDFDYGEDDEPQPDVNPYKPAPKFRETVKPVLDQKLSRNHATALAAMYHKLRQDVMAGNARLNTYQDLADQLAARGASLSVKGLYPGYKTALGSVLKAAFGEAERPIEPGLLDFLETLAWATWETGT